MSAACHAGWGSAAAGAGLGSSVPGDIHSGGSRCHPWAGSASPLPVHVPPPAPRPPHSSCFCSRVPATPKEVLGPSPSWRKGPRVPEASPSPRARHVGPRRLSPNSRRRGRGGLLVLGPAPPRQSEEGRPPAARGPRRRLPSSAPSLPPDTEVPVPKLPHAPGPHDSKLQPATRSPWLSPRGLAFGRPRPAQKARARRAPRKAPEAAAVAAPDPWRAAAGRRRRRSGGLGAVAGPPARRACALPAGGWGGGKAGPGGTRPEPAARSSQVQPSARTRDSERRAAEGAAGSVPGAGALGAGLGASQGCSDAAPRRGRRGREPKS